MLTQLLSFWVNTNTENFTIFGMHGMFIMSIGELYYGFQRKSLTSVTKVTMLLKATCWYMISTFHGKMWVKTVDMP